MEFILSLIGAFVVGGFLVAIFLDENPIIAFLAGLGTAYGFIWYNDLSLSAIITFIGSNLFELFLGFLAYTFVGVLWGIYKWIRHLKKSAKKLRNVVNAFEKEVDPKDYSVEVTSADGNTLYDDDGKPQLKVSKDKKEHAFKEFYQNQTGQYFRGAVPEFTQNKARFTGWVIFWPFNIFGYFFSDILKGFFDDIYEAVATYVEKLKKKYFAGMEEYVDMSK